MATPFAATAQGAGHRGPERHLFAPETVMQHQSAIKLQAGQRAEITQAIKDFQARMVELQWKLQEETEKLDALLEKSSVNQAAALAQIDAVLALERDIKRAHLGLLIEIKNKLTIEQQQQLGELHRHPPTGSPHEAPHLPGAGDSLPGASGFRR